MLVLTRRTDESIMIGDPKSADAPIEITVTDIRGGDVRIGVEAPVLVVVDRKGIWEEKREKAG